MCFNPLIRSNGKIIGSVKGAKEHLCVDDKMLRDRIKTGKYSLIPCRQCLECRNTYARNWAARIEEEAGYYENTSFITLTYDDEHIPVHNIFEDTKYKGLVNPLAYVQGATIERPYIEYDDMQKFMKRLREHAERKNLAETAKNGQTGIRFFGCGEYGDLSLRPHFHIIIFGLRIPDLKIKYRKNGYEHDQSDLMEEIWQKQGIVDIGSVTYRSARYVAQYAVKKQKGLNKDLYKDLGLTPPDVRMSRRPGIGSQYWQDHRDAMYKTDRIYLAEGRTQKPPQYYDILEDRKRIEEEEKILNREFKEIEDAEENETKTESTFMSNLKTERRKKANDALFAKLRQTSGITIEEYFEIKQKKYENNHKAALDRGHENKS